MSYSDEQLRELASWLPGFRELEEVEEQIADLWIQLKTLRKKAKRIKDGLGTGCPLPLDDLEARYWSKVGIVDDEDSCWEWTRTRGPVPGDYGKFRWLNPVTGRSEVVAASFASLFLTSGALPVQGNHHCDNPPCCRPKHLYDGTHMDNMRDRRERGRYTPRKALQGAGNPQSKLTDKLVTRARELARNGMTLPQVHQAIQCPASMTVLRWAITGRTWKHLNAVCPPVVKARNGSAIKGKQVAHRPPSDRAFNDNQVRAIRWARSADNPAREKLKALADQYDVSLGMISSVEHRRSYAHVIDQEEP
jgi:hypothetical protein